MEEKKVLKRTALYGIHEDLGAMMVEFAGYLMPLRYKSFKEEALATRNAAGLFDISHMGKITIRGPGAKNFLQRLTTNDIEKLQPDKALYTLLCNENGGVVDDIIVYQIRNSYLLVVNGACLKKDLDWLKKCREYFKVKIVDRTAALSMIALQGPNSAKILKTAGLEKRLLNLEYFTHGWGHLDRIPIRISRTGYTGEDGFEIFVSPEKAAPCWQRLMLNGENNGLAAVGLGARDNLRLEAGLPLYGHELSEEITPLEAGLERFVSFKKGDFIGREALLKQKRKGTERKLIGFEIMSGRIAHQGYQIFKQGQAIGEVSSGIASWSLNKSIGTGFVKQDFTAPGNLIEIDINGKTQQAKITAPPFYRRKKAR